MATARNLTALGVSNTKPFLSLLALSLVVAPLALAQAEPNPAPQPSFEVATIKPAAPAERGNGVWSPPGIGRFWAKGVSLEFLIEMAFGVSGNQVAAKPAWIDSEFFDIEAKPESGIALSREELKPRLQSLFAERFHLATHYETRMVPGYALAVAKGGPRLQATKGDHFPGFRIYVGPGSLEGINWSMSYLASMLEKPAGRPVLDATGIGGSYDIKLEYAPDMEDSSSLPSIFTALKETLGLELRAQHVPVQVLIIDRVDRVPGDN